MHANKNSKDKASQRTTLSWIEWLLLSIVIAALIIMLHLQFGVSEYLIAH